MLRTFSRTLASALIALVSVSAAESPVIKFSDVNLKNGLRVIVSEDHTAPDGLGGGQLQRRVGRREGPAAPASPISSST